MGERASRVPSDQLRILHVLPADLMRGAQMEARVVCDALDGRFGQHRAMTLFAAPPGALRPEISLGVSDGWGRRSGLDPRVLLPLRRQLQTSPVDVLISHGGEPLKYLAPVLPTLRRRPRVVYRNIGTSRFYFRSRGQLAFNRFVLGRADQVVCMSQRVAEESRGLLRLPPERVVVIPNARRPDVYRPGERNRAGPVRIVSVGALSPEKRPERFISVIAALRKRGADVEAAWIGDGPMRQDVTSPAAAAGVELMGRRTDVPDLLRGADIFVLASRAEGMPGVLVEAALTGLPIVTTDVEGADEIVDHDVSGLIVPVDDEKGMVEALARLVADHDLRRRMGSAGRAHALQEFAVDVVAARWIAVLEGLLDRPRR